MQIGTTIRQLGWGHAITIVVMLYWGLGAWAQVEQTLVTFTGSNGAAPYTGLIEDSKGHFYGATSNGGVNGTGVVFALIKNSRGQWMEKILYQFGVNGQGDGHYPVMDHLAIDSKGNLYGTTAGGGALGGGTVFKLSPGTPYWKESILYSFGMNDAVGGNDPQGGVALGSNGVIYGTTNSGGGGGYCGGGGCGVVFLLKNKSGTWAQTVLHVFTGIPPAYQCNVIYDGENPGSMTPVLDSAGNVFGTTSNGGDGCGNGGSIWELSAAGGGRFNYSLLYAPIGFDRFSFPHGGVILDSQGNLYAFAGSDVVAEFVKSQGYAEQILWDSQSCGINPCPGGSYDTVSMDKAGNLYWTTYTGSQTLVGGTVDELSPDGQGGWNFSVLHTFPSNPPSEGTAPYNSVWIDASGNLYGTNSGGGTTGSCTQYPYCNGTVWEITP